MIDLLKRSKLAMFRFGVLPSGIETGRYKGEPMEDSRCNLCDLNEIETEKLIYYIVHSLISKKVIYFIQLDMT